MMEATEPIDHTQITILLTVSTVLTGISGKDYIDTFVYFAI